MHLDHHDDAASNHPYHLGSGGFVQQIKKYTNAKHGSVLLLGSENWGDGNIWTSQQGISLIEEKDLKNIGLKELIRKQPEKDVYLSCDLDVLSKREFSDNCSRGSLNLNEAKQIITQRWKT